MSGSKRDNEGFAQKIREVIGEVEATIVPNRVLEDRNLEPDEKLVLVYLSYFTDSLTRTVIAEKSIGVMIVKMMAKADTDDPDLFNILSRLSGIKKGRVVDILEKFIDKNIIKAEDVQKTMGSGGGRAEIENLMKNFFERN